MWVRVGWWSEDLDDNPDLPEFLEVPDDKPETEISRHIKAMPGIGVRPRGWAGPVTDEERGVTAT